jgi:mutator protein MutT
MAVCTLVFLRQDDQILLAMKKRGFGEGRWNGVGGKVDAGETVEQAMIRETQEEISVTPVEYRQVAYLDFTIDADTKPWHQEVHVYTCTKWEGEPTESEEMAPQWYTLNAIPYSDMWQDDEIWLPQVLRNRLVRGAFTFDHTDAMQHAEFDIVDAL